MDLDKGVYTVPQHLSKKEFEAAFMSGQKGLHGR
jgi:hypothetical protein